MTPKDKLAEFEAQYFKHLDKFTDDVRISFDRKDVRWLIARVRRLTEALEYIQKYAGHNPTCKSINWCEAGCEYKIIARQALEGSDE